MTKEEKKNMSIANCRICLLSKSNCEVCPLNWALDMLDIEKTLTIEEIHVEYLLKTSPAFVEVYNPK